jgi:hypothetical protein
MNSIKQITSGLSSSLFLAVGLTRLAEKADPMPDHVKNSVANGRDIDGCEPSIMPCLFTPNTGE